MATYTLPGNGDSNWGTPLSAAIDAVNAEVEAATSDIGDLEAGKLDISEAAELIRDTIGAALVAGSNVTITPNDGANTITIAATAPGLDTEAVQDAVAAMLLEGSGVDLSYNDAAGTLTISSTGGGGSSDIQFVDDLDDIAPGTPVDTLIVVRSA